MTALPSDTGPQQLELQQPIAGGEGGLVGRADEGDVRPHHVADRAGEERIVRASEQEGVDVGITDRREQALGEHHHLVADGLATLDELDEARDRRH